METSKSIEPAAAAQRRRERIEHLLGKYPDISADEKVEISQFLQSVDAISLGLLSEDSGSRRKLQHFRRDQRAGSASLRQSALVIVTIILLLLGLGALLWDAGTS